MSFNAAPNAWLATLQLITAVTITSIVAGLVTTPTAHGLSTGQTVIFGGLTGASNILNGSAWYITSASSTTFNITPVHSVTQSSNAAATGGCYVVTSTSGGASAFNISGSCIAINLADLGNLTVTTANASTGDVREVVRCLSEAFYQAFLTAGSAGQPAKMRLGRQTIANDSNGTINVTYTSTFTETGTFVTAAE